MIAERTIARIARKVAKVCPNEGYNKKAARYYYLARTNPKPSVA